MKTTLSRSLFSSAAIALAVSAAPVVKAGPGIDYWKRMSDIQAAATAPKAAAAATGAVCADAKVVDITTTQNAWQNGRGPLVTTVVAHKVVCTSCGATTTVSKHGWLNGKGPSVTSTVKMEHDCTSCGLQQKS